MINALSQAIPDTIIHGNLSDLKRLSQHEDFAIDDVDAYGYTPLIESVIANSYEKTAFLLEQGADIHKPDLVGRTALHWAADNSQQPICRLLLEKGADPNAYTNAGQCVLVTPLLRDNQAIKEVLYEYGASLTFAQDFSNAKLLGHRFNLQGHSDIIDPEQYFVEVNLEGFILEYTLNVLTDSFQRFLNHYITRQHKSLAKPLKIIPAILNNASQLIQFQHYLVDKDKIQTKVNSLLKTSILFLPIIYKGHAITLIKLGHYLVWCDRGEHGREKGCLVIYRMNNHRAWHLQLMKFLLYKRQDKHFIEKELPQMLGLEVLHHLPMEPQVTGNCSWANIEGAVLGALFLVFLHSDDTNASKDAIEQKAINIYNLWQNWDKDIALNECIQHINSSDDPGRRATKASLLGAILFQRGEYRDPHNENRARKILNVLEQDDFSYIMRAYISIYKNLKSGRRFLDLLDYFDADI
ncbi:MAG: ankyrin repeat domain-containing protein [Gammaproteobacteria bacterium]